MSLLRLLDISYFLLCLVLIYIVQKKQLTRVIFSEQHLFTFISAEFHSDTFIYPVSKLNKSKRIMALICLLLQ